MAKGSEFQTEQEKSLRWFGSLAGMDWNVIVEAPFGKISAGDLLASWVMHDNLHISVLIELQCFLLVKKSEPFNTQYAGEW